MNDLVSLNARIGVMEQLGEVAGHKHFVTQLFRYAYRDGDARHRENWSLDWPQESIPSGKYDDCTSENV